MGRRYWTRLASGIAASVLCVVAILGITHVLTTAVPLPPLAVPVRVTVRYVETSNEILDVYTVSDGTECWIVVGRFQQNLAMTKARPALCEDPAR